MWEIGLYHYQPLEIHKGSQATGKKRENCRIQLGLPAVCACRTLVTGHRTGLPLSRVSTPQSISNNASKPPCTLAMSGRRNRFFGTSASPYQGSIASCHLASVISSLWAGSKPQKRKGKVESSGGKPWPTQHKISTFRSVFAKLANLVPKPKSKGIISMDPKQHSRKWKWHCVYFTRYF